MSRVQRAKIYKSRQLSWSVWHHPTGSVHTVSSLFTQESEAAQLPDHAQLAAALHFVFIRYLFIECLSFYYRGGGSADDIKVMIFITTAVPLDQVSACKR